jgi:hypothetical protein
MSIKKRLLQTATVLSFTLMAVPLAHAGQLFPPEGLQLDTHGNPDPTKNCPNGYVLSWDGPNGAVMCTGDTVPSHAVMMFNLPSCPTGWSPMPAMEGRVPVASGYYDENSAGPNGVFFSQTYRQGDLGGFATTSLRMDQMPKHSHQARITNGLDDGSLGSLWAHDFDQRGYIEFDWTGTGGYGGPYQGATLNGYPAPLENPGGNPYQHSLIGINGDGAGPFLSNGYTGGTPDLQEGQATPIDTRMPYHVLTFCEKN